VVIKALNGKQKQTDPKFCLPSAEKGFSHGKLVRRTKTFVGWAVKWKYTPTDRRCNNEL